MRECKHGEWEESCIDCLQAQNDKLKKQVKLVEDAASLPDGTRAAAVLIYMEDWDAKKTPAGDIAE